MIVKTAFMGKVKDNIYLNSYDDVIDLTEQSSRLKYDSFKHIIPPISTTYFLPGGMYNLIIDFVMSSKMIENTNGSYTIDIVVSKIYGVISRNGKIVIEKSINNDIIQDPEHIKKYMEYICASMVDHVDDIVIKDFLITNSGSEYKSFRYRDRVRNFIKILLRSISNTGNNVLSYVCSINRLSKM